MSDEGGWRRYSRRGALGLMGVGGIAVVSETMGFTDVSRGRGVNIGVDEDDEAILQIVADPGGKDTVLTDSDAQPFGPSLDIEITNNAAEMIDISSVESDADVSNDFDSDSEGSLNQDESTTVTFENETENEQDSDIEIEADVGTNLKIERSDIDFRAIDSLTLDSDPDDPGNDDNTTITASIEDTEGDPAEGIDITFDVTDGDGDFNNGDSTTKTTDNGGEASTTYSPADEDDDSTIKIESTVKINGLSEEIELDFNSG